MSETEIPCPEGMTSSKMPAIAYFSEKQTGAGRKKLRAAGISAATQLSEYPELFEGPRPGESDEARAARIEAIKMKLTPEQAEFIDNIKEATVLATLESWTLDQPIPRTLEELEALDGDLFDALLEATVATPDTSFEFDGTKLDSENVGKAAGIGEATFSSGPSSETLDSTQTPIPSTDGSATDGDNFSLVQ